MIADPTRCRRPDHTDRMRRRALQRSVIAIVLSIGLSGCAGTDRRRVPLDPSACRRLICSTWPRAAVNLARYQPTKKPLLVWAWAPYCPYCRREAPAVEQFARLHRADLQVVGVGTQNTAGEARAFRQQTGIRSFPLLYEADGFRSWKPFGFVAQPAAALLSAKAACSGRGAALRRSRGPPPHRHLRSRSGFGHDIGSLTTNLVTKARAGWFW